MTEKEAETSQGKEIKDINGVANDAVEVEAEPEETEPEADPDPEKPKNGKRRRLFMIGGVALLLLVIGGLAYWLYARQFESTDDAFIDGDIVQVSPKVSSYVSKIYVKSNQIVHKGDLLVELDPRDFEVRLEQARAQLEAARSQRGVANANVDLTTRTAGAGQQQARSNVETSLNNVEQTRLAAESKRSQIDQARATVRTSQATLEQQRALVDQAKSNTRLAEVEYNRRKALFDRGDISRQSLDQATNALETARAQQNAAQKQVNAAQARVDEANAGVAAASENYRQAVAQINLSASQVNESRGRLEEANAGPEQIEVSKSQVETAEASIAAAEAAVHQAELELSYTKIYAPEDGYVTRKTIEEGQLVQAGAPLMALSESQEVWIVANFKETQLELMRVGQPVEISVDAYPGETFHGKVESFQAGTGSRFSLLPAENATGNFVKVVQRVPVKIVFDEQPDKLHLLAPGMSVEPTVKVR